MHRKRKSDYYTPEELKKIKEQWLKDKARIDADPAFYYPYDSDREYQRHLHNKNLQTLFKYAARFYRELQHENELFLFPGEDKKIKTIFKEIVKNGYFTDSKTEEKAVRAHLGKISSRQSYIRYKKGKFRYKK